MHVTFLGGAQEVGRNSILVGDGNAGLVMDYGLDVQEMKTPMIPKGKISGVFVTHGHLDHVGAVPQVYRMGYGGSVFATNTTHDISYMMLVDSMKVQEKRGLQPFFTPADMEAMYERKRDVKLGKSMAVGGFSVVCQSAGHVPGSMGVLAESGGKKVLYTGDIKFSETRLMMPAFTDYGNIDAIVCESTYMNKNHPDRKALEKELKNMVLDTVQGGGTILLPCFAVGRTQEMLLILTELDMPLYLDGMGIEATEIILSHPQSMKDYGKLEDAFSRAIKVGKPRQRKEALRSPSIVISTAGMLNGGPIHHYIRKVYDKENCSIVMTGYQAEGTVGRKLLDTGKYTHENMDKNVRMLIKFMDFSAHCGRDDLLAFLKKTSPEKVMLMHSGDTQRHAEELKSMGFDAYAPRNGDTIKV